MSIDGESLRRQVARAQQGDRLAAEWLIREHEGWVRSAIYAVTGRADIVDDIAQQVWMRVWERLGTLEDPGRLRPWLYTTARNTAIDVCTAERRRRQLAGAGEIGEVADGDGDPFRAVAGDELKDVLVQAVRALPALYREPFVLRHLEGWGYAEIGDVLELPADAVETRLVRARRMLREMLHPKVAS